MEKKKQRILKIGEILFISTIVIVANIVVSPAYVIDGDTVYFEDSNVYLSATPHTITSSGWVYFNLTSKLYTGNIDAAWGFNTSVSIPRKAELYAPHWVNTTSDNKHTFYHVSTFSVYTGTDLDYGNTYNTYRYNVTHQVPIYNETTMEIEDFEEATFSKVAFDSYTIDENNYTTFWHTRHDKWVLWKDYTHTFNSVVHDYEGYDKWYYVTNIPVTSGVEYQMRAWVEVPVSLNLQTGKYYFAVKPSSETISEAIANGHFYNLDPWWNSSWDYKKQVTVSHVNASGSTLTNYTAYINVSKETAMQADFDDVYFVNNSDVTMDFECENTSTDYAHFWVRIPSLPTSGTTFWMYYGNSGATSGEDPENTWDHSAKLVMHLQDMVDSTINNNDGTNHGATYNDSGKVDGAYDFDGSNDYIDCVSDNSLNITDAITVEAWIRKTGTHGSLGWIMERITGNDGYNAYINTDGKVRWELKEGGTAKDCASDSAIGLDVWVHIVGTLESGTQKLYINSVLQLDTESMTSIGEPNKNLHIGMYSGSNFPFNGAIDELRIYNQSSTADTINQTYQLITNQSTFVTFGAAQSETGTTPSISNVVNGSINSTAQNVNWSVNQSAHNWVKYSNESDLTPTYYSSWHNSTNAPNITITGLTRNTKYYYQAWSYNTSNTSLTDNSSTFDFTTAHGANLTIANVINIKEDWGQDFYSNLSGNVTNENASGVWLNFTNAEFTNTSLGWLNMTLDEWANESHNANAPVSNVSITVYLNATIADAVNDSESFWYDVTKRTNTATMNSAATQNKGTSENFFINSTLNEEYDDTYYGAADLLEDGVIIATNSSVVDYGDFSHSESSPGQYNYTVRFYNSTHYDNATTSTYSNVTVTVAEYIPPSPISLVNATTNFWCNFTWSAGSGNDTDAYNVSINTTWDNTSSNVYYNNSVLSHGWSNISVYAFNNTGSGTLNTTNITDTMQIPNNAITITNTSDANVDEGDNVYVDYDSTDADGDTPTFSCNRTDLFSDFNTATGIGNWLTDYTDSGTYYVDFGVSDGYGSTSNYTMTITVTDVTSTLHSGNIFNIKEDWGQEFYSNFSANVTGVNTSNVRMNFTNAEFANASLGWLNLTLNEWVNESHNSNVPVTNVSVTIYLNSTMAGTTNDTETFYYEVAKRTNTATMDSSSTQSVYTSETFYVNATCNEEYGDTFLGAANLLEDGSIIDTDTTVTDYVNFSHSESSAGAYNYTVRFYNMSYYDNVTTSTYSNVTVSVHSTIPSITGEYPTSPVQNDTSDSSVTFGATINQSTAKNQWLGDFGSGNTTLEWDNGTSSPAYANTTFNQTIGDRSYTIYVKAYNSSDSTLNTSSSWIWNISDVTPPASITGLTNSTYATTYINWTWTNPGDSDFNHTTIYINESYETNVSTAYYNDTGLSENTQYNISIRTVDVSDNINQTWINTTAFTASEPPSEYTPPIPTGIANVTGNFWANHTWDAGTGNVTDSYNVSINSTWHNTTVTLYYNNTGLAAHAWSNATVWAFNSTGIGTLSVGDDSENVQIPNNAPILAGLPNNTTDENTNQTDIFDLDDYFTDADDDTPTFLVESNNQSGYVTVSINASNNVSYSLSSGWNGVAEVVINATDGWNGESNDTFLITVNDVGTPPSISSVTNGSISGGSQWIDWTVNQTAHNQVKYSNESDLTPLYLSSWDNATAAPNISLTGLTPSTQYWYQAWSYNTTTVSLTDNASTLTFNTSAVSDTDAPVISNTSVFPTRIYRSENVTILCTVVDNESSVQTVTIRVQNPNGGIGTYGLSMVGGTDNWTYNYTHTSTPGVYHILNFVANDTYSNSLNQSSLLEFTSISRGGGGGGGTPSTPTIYPTLTPTPTSTPTPMPTPEPIQWIDRPPSPINVTDIVEETNIYMIKYIGIIVLLMAGTLMGILVVLIKRRRNRI